MIIQGKKGQEITKQDRKEQEGRMERTRQSKDRKGRS
jgi:hypothetical protein